jgi:hypothetical protein
VKLRIKLQVGTLNPLKSLLPVRTAAEAIRLLGICENVPSGEVFNLAGSPPLDMKTIMTLIERALGKTAFDVRVPEAWIRVGARVFDGSVGALFAGAPSADQVIQSFTSSAWSDDSKLKKIVRLSPIDIQREIAAAALGDTP